MSANHSPPSLSPGYFVPVDPPEPSVHRTGAVVLGILSLIIGTVILAGLLKLAPNRAVLATRLRRRRPHWNHVWSSNLSVFGPAQFCDHCGNSVLSNGYACLVCGRCSHSSHLDHVDAIQCKHFSEPNTSPVTPVQQLPPTEHRWAHGNIPPNTRCDVCWQPCEDSSRPQLGSRCLWCAAAVHSECRPVVERSPCSLGEVPQAVLDPRWVLPANSEFAKQNGGSGGGAHETTGKSAPQASTAGSKPGTKPPRPAASPTVSAPFLVMDFPSTTTPVLVLINPRSGAQQGPLLLRAFYGLLNPCQICDLSREQPNQFFACFASVLSRCRVLVCGGDGTVGWVLESLSLACGGDSAAMPPVGILPTGTGNDLALVLNWNAPTMPGALCPYLHSVLQGTPSPLDRWRVTVTPRKSTPRTILGSRHTTSKVVYATNYVSIGLDAHIALEFHTAREQRPGWFRSRWINKLIYVFMGTRIAGRTFIARMTGSLGSSTQMASPPTTGERSEDSRLHRPTPVRAAAIPSRSGEELASSQLRSHKRPQSPPTLRRRLGAATSNSPSSSNPLPAISIPSNGSALPPESALPPRSPSPAPVHDLSHIATLHLGGRPVPLDGLAGLILQNIPSYAGGRRLYRPRGDQPAADPSDALLDVVGVWGAAHMAASLAHLTGLEVIGRAPDVELVLKPEPGNGVALQVDGEPWLQEDECVVKIEHVGRVVMLRRADDEVADEDDENDELVQVDDRGRPFSVLKHPPRRSTSLLVGGNQSTLERLFW
ncbi:hypothetical protein M427DRAFT_53379 [Gonapodya prolifera JEL478]|uniref:Diacylglycerol kinase n=1 Tax=Gonapodya prolifera (strain JEL478) TaxID=1344416 RepID=A0A139AQ96_GONPJ|nr:hypothetical protein M427DRAFT_53379 [Gonapodya prolifera JEL478]|eukprot:KXS18898.1 hypothetical protein M427DRAFT_53379 [Gonapodya prolifera JEL478]